MKNRIIICIVILLPVAIFYNAGLVELRLEEPRRALVALEMLFRKSYLVPQIHGQLYFTKPPLFNWTIALSFWLFGNYSELAARTPGLLSYLATGLVIFWFAKQYVNKEKALLAALFYYTASDLFLFGTLIPAEIDLFFALLITLQLTSLYYFFSRQKWLAMFTVSYTLMALSVLTKGVPAILFEGITVFVLFTYYRKIKLLLSWQHAAGIACFLLIAGSYFYAYQQATGKLYIYFAKLFNDATDKSVLEHSLWDSVLNFLASPLYMIRFFSPWFLYVLFVFKKPPGNQHSFRHNFFGCWLWVVAINIIPMVFTNDTKANYIYPLFPFIGLLLAHIYLEYRQAHKKLDNAINWLFFGVMIIVTIALLVAPAISIISNGVNYLWLKTILLAAATATIALLFYRNPGVRIYLLILFLVVLRLIESSYYLPLFKSGSKQVQFAAFIDSITQQAKGNSIYLGGKPEIQHARIAIGPLAFDSVSVSMPPYIFFGAPYYYSIKTGQVMKYDSVFSSNRYYLLLSKEAPDSLQLQLLNRFKPSERKPETYYFVTPR
jgi:4-amino-4-deoxy-L-arabinose transferase-like glycosyltransferase